MHAGESLRDTRWKSVDIRTVDVYHQQQRVHNLTIVDIHTYYVLAGNTPVLVHNSNLHQHVVGYW
ncbi:hypothetical protein [Actinophytocola sp. NPDC049390]|uniref:hypothetical protein n=1 Tax=Actinophytocola sp. NPDC049390 TaxID=3363894 RepID=UPI003787486F